MAKERKERRGAEVLVTGEAVARVTSTWTS